MLLNKTHLLLQMIEGEEETDGGGQSQSRLDLTLARALDHLMEGAAARASVCGGALVALPRAFALARSLGDWIGATSESIALQSVPKEFQKRASGRRPRGGVAAVVSPWNSP